MYTTDIFPSLATFSKVFSPCSKAQESHIQNIYLVPDAGNVHFCLPFLFFANPKESLAVQIPPQT